MKKTYFIVCLSFMLGVGVTTMAQVDPGTANLKHQWTFEDGTANDVVGSVNGTLSGTATVANGDLITGDAGWVGLDAAALAVNTYTELTVTAWFTSTVGANTGYHFLYYFGNSDGNGNHFTGYTPARGNDVSRFMIGTTGEAGIDTREYDDGLLHNVSCVIDATTVSYYMDGNLVNSVAIGNSKLSEVGIQFAYFAKGGWPDPNWKGLIHEISIYNKALTADNVKFLYNLKAPAAIPATDPGTVNLKHQWTFDDGTATDVIAGVNGTLMDGAVVVDKALNTTAGGYVTLDAGVLAVKTYSELTVESWFTSAAGSNPSFHFLYYFGNSDGNGNHFTGYTPARGTNLSRFMIATGNGEDNETQINTTEFDDGLLHHMVSVIDATTLSGYIDGNLITKEPISPNSLSNLGNQLAYFGKGGWGNDPIWKGQTHRISIYDKALTANNVKFLYSAGPEITTNPGTGVNQTMKMIQNVYVSNNQIVAEFESSSAASAQIEVYSTQGTLLSSEKFACNTGLNHKTIQANFPAGIYLVRLTVAGQSGYTKLVK